MKLYKKEGNTVHVLRLPHEDVEKGDYLLIEDPDGRALVVHVVDVQFANVPGVLEELLRSCAQDGGYIEGEDIDPLEIASHVELIQDAGVLVCKVRATLEEGRLTNDTAWLPSRASSTIKKLPVSDLLSLADVDGGLPIYLGETKEGSPLFVDVKSFDGRLNIITGKKETGKSHLSKLLVLGLVHYGATVIVLDLNGEYTELGLSADGKPSDYYNKVHVLIPAQSFKVSLKQVDLRIMSNILVHALRLPGTSAREFRRIWRFLEERNMLTLRDLGEAIRGWQCNQHVRDALFSRYHALLNSGFFTDEPEEVVSFEGCLEKAKGNGGAIIINLRDMSSVDRQIVVEYALSKLVEFLTSWRLRAAFLFAEEAHLYLRETYWDDIITRMRHLGVFTTFVTNQPDSIKESIYRQADNIFLFNFTNEHDLEIVSRAAKVDVETVKSIARDLPLHHCLILGKVVKDFPITIKVRTLNVRTKGQTRLFFTPKGC